MELLLLPVLVVVLAIVGAAGADWAKARTGSTGTMSRALEIAFDRRLHAAVGVGAITVVVLGRLLA